MNKLLFAIALLSIIPAMRAQQSETNGTSPEAAPQPAAQNPNAQDNLPAAIRPGHPLDPADVDILTGKRDRELEASRMAALPISVGMYGNYGDLYAMQGRFGRTFDNPMLPLTRISNPFFFFHDAAARFWTRRVSGRPLNDIRLPCAFFFTGSQS
jgi:hypothetical protein